MQVWTWWETGPVRKTGLPGEHNRHEDVCTRYKQWCRQGIEWRRLVRRACDPLQYLTRRHSAKAWRLMIDLKTRGLRSVDQDSYCHTLDWCSDAICLVREERAELCNHGCTFSIFYGRTSADLWTRHMPFTLLQGKAYAPTVQRYFLIKSAHVNAVKVHIASYGRKFCVDWAGFYPCTYCWWHAAGRLIVDKVWEKKLAVSVCSVLQCKALRKVEEQLYRVWNVSWQHPEQTHWLTISLPWKFRPILAKRTGNWHLHLTCVRKMLNLLAAWTFQLGMLRKVNTPVLQLCLHTPVNRAYTMALVLRTVARSFSNAPNVIFKLLLIKLLLNHDIN